MELKNVKKLIDFYKVLDPCVQGKWAYVIPDGRKRRSNSAISVE